MQPEKIQQNQFTADRTDSYGAIVLERTQDGSLFVLLIKSMHGWSFPKGHIEQGETPEETAVRETKEETGIDIAVDTSFSAWVDSARPGDKRKVCFFLGKSLSGLAEPSPQMEIKEAKWVDCDSATELIGYLPDRQALLSALSFLKEASLCL